VLNKIDAVGDHSRLHLLTAQHPKAVCVSGLTGAGIADLEDAVISALSADFTPAEVVTPAANGKVLAFLNAHAEIYRQEPDSAIAWRSTSGAQNGGEVRFSSAGGNRTRITLTMSYDPEGFIENVGDALGAVSIRVQGDLNRFKEFIESRGSETGAWRGEIRGGSVSGK
jgi:hypothetical protein